MEGSGIPCVWSIWKQQVGGQVSGRGWAADWKGHQAAGSDGHDLVPAKSYRLTFVGKAYL